MKIVHVVGARPNFMKIAPIIDAVNAYNNRTDRKIQFEQILVHTGQHYDHQLSELFFEQLGMPRPDINLHVGSGPHGQQTGRVMEAFEKVLMEIQPDMVLVAGDVNSTLACAVDAKKLGIAVAHVEAGLRSFDMSMPEEINRIVTDSISDILFTTDRIADRHLIREGVDASKIHFIGNVMIDSLLKHREKALATPVLETLALKNIPYALVTLHRPGNVDDQIVMRGISEALTVLAEKMQVIFPVHPRTRARLEAFGFDDIYHSQSGIRLLEPQGYLDFLNLMANARLILTDSGGIQEESTILNVPCLTLRPNTERPITIEQGTNLLVGNRKEDILKAIENPKNAASGIRPELWDGNAAGRIVEKLAEWYCTHQA